MTREVAVVPHTHWDREWYAAFQTFRLNLVDLVDDLLPLLEADPGFAHFMLDGQMAVVDDYLAVRPEEEGRLRALAGSGRLGMGPWYVLMDEFLVSAETMVRDLQLGLAKAAGFGGAMEVGYLPDMFGHVAQMPQLLRQFGLDHAVVWRGVPSAVDRSAFWWSAPDGSTVRAEYLIEGYGNGAALPDDTKELLAMIERFERDHASFLRSDDDGPDDPGEAGPILWMNGTDHLLPKAYLGRVVAEANALQDDYRLHVTSLAAYLSTARSEGLPRWRGELRSGARANLLMGVGSNRVDVKQAAAGAERAIERLAEPLSALFLPPGRWPGALLDVAWLEMIRNSAHDSSCACSIDEVVDAVRHRYAEARQVADGLVERATAALAASVVVPGPVAVNASARSRGGVVELVLVGTEPVAGTQVLHVSDGRAGAEGLTRQDCVTLVQAAMDGMAELRDVEIEVLEIERGEEGPGVLDVRLVCSVDDTGTRYHGPAKGVIAERAAEAPDGPARIAVVTPPSQRVLAWVDDVPGYGWTHVEPQPLPVDEVRVTEPDGRPRLANGRVVVEVDPDTGTFGLASPDGLVHVDGLDRLVDDGDGGDTYNYSPPDADLVVDEPTKVVVTMLERGPLRARVRIDRTYRWPERVFAAQRSGEREVTVTTTLELVADRALVRVTTELTNPCRDHRLRTWFPLPRRAGSSHAECAFAVVERGLRAEGGPHERPMATFPSRRFVIAGGLTVVHEGLLEYELVDLRTDDDPDRDDRDDGEGAGEGAETAGALALTLLRATGLLSNGPMRYRPLPAGPIVPVEGAQMIGPQTFRYGLMLGDDPAAAYGAVDEAFLPLLVRTAPGGGRRPARGTELDVGGAEVSAVVRDAGHLVVRVFNPTDEPTEVRIRGRRGWLRDLRGRTLESFEERFALEPWQIATAQLAD